MNLGIEDEFVEFKKSTGQTSRALEAIVAMLNKHGKAKVLFGVEDNGDVVGQTIGNKTITDLSSAISSGIKPAVIPIIKVEIYDNKTIIVVEVEGNNKPYSANGNYLIRSGNENKKIEPDILKELIYSSNGELMVNIESMNQDLTFRDLKQLYILKGFTINDDTFIRNLGLLCKNGKYNLLAEILADNNDLSIKVVRFKGIDKTELLFRNEYGYKCLFIALEQALNYVYSLNETRVDLDNKIARVETHLFDNNCLREAWINACLHTKWSKMIPPVIYIYQDRIEIVSYGGLAVDYNLDEFYLGISHPINKQLQKIMGQLGFVEQTGHGIPTILKKYGKEAFTITNNNLIVTLKFPFMISSLSLDLTDLNEQQKEILNLIKLNPSIKVKDIAKLMKLSESRINEIIKELKNANKIIRIGANKNGYYKVL